MDGRLRYTLAAGEFILATALGACQPQTPNPRSDFSSTPTPLVESAGRAEQTSKPAVVATIRPKPTETPTVFESKRQSVQNYLDHTSFYFGQLVPVSELNYLNFTTFLGYIKRSFIVISFPEALPKYVRFPDTQPQSYPIFLSDNTAGTIKRYAALAKNAPVKADTKVIMSNEQDKIVDVWDAINEGSGNPQFVPELVFDTNRVKFDYLSDTPNN